MNNSINKLKIAKQNNQIVRVCCKSYTNRNYYIMGTISTIDEIEIKILEKGSILNDTIQIDDILNVQVFEKE